MNLPVSLPPNSDEEIPLVVYTSEETSTWSQVYTRCRKMNMVNSCAVYRRTLEALESEQILSVDFVPQLRHLSNYMQSESFRSFMFPRSAVEGVENRLKVAKKGD